MVRPPRAAIVGLGLAGIVGAGGAVLFLASPPSPARVRLPVGEGEGFVLDPLREHLLLLEPGGGVARFDVHTLARLEEVRASGSDAQRKTPRIVLRGAEVLFVDPSDGEPLLPGGARDGRLPDGAPLLLAERRLDAIVAVTLDGAPWRPAVAPPWWSAALSPDGRHLAVTAAARDGRKVDLAVLATVPPGKGEVVARRADVAAVAPCWLPDGRGLLLERPGGGLWRLPLDGEESYVGPVRLSRHPARGARALPHGPDRVLVESVDAEGFLELTSVRVGDGDPGPERTTRQLTSGRVAHFGPAWAGGGRYLLFRRTAEAPGSGEDAVVLVDRETPLHSWVVARRQDASPDPRWGPQASSDGRFVFVVEDGVVWRIDFDPPGLAGG